MVRYFFSGAITSRTQGHPTRDGAGAVLFLITVIFMGPPAYFFSCDMTSRIQGHPTREVAGALLFLMTVIFMMRISTQRR